MTEGEVIYAIVSTGMSGHVPEHTLLQQCGNQQKRKDLYTKWKKG